MSDPRTRISLRFWQAAGELAALANLGDIWWDRVQAWLETVMVQIDPDTAALPIVELLAWQRNVDRFPAETDTFFRARVRNALANAKDAGSVAGFARIFARLSLGAVQQTERFDATDWDVITLEVTDAELAANQDLFDLVIRKYGRTCRRYTYATQQPITLRHRTFDFDRLTQFATAAYSATPSDLHFTIDAIASVSPIVTAANIPDALVIWTRPDGTQFAGKAPASSNFSAVGEYMLWVSDVNEVTCIDILGYLAAFNFANATWPEGLTYLSLATEQADEDLADATLPGEQQTVDLASAAISGHGAALVWPQNSTHLQIIMCEGTGSLATMTLPASIAEFSTTGIAQTQAQLDAFFANLADNLNNWPALTAIDMSGTGALPSIGGALSVYSVQAAGIAVTLTA